MRVATTPNLSLKLAMCVDVYDVDPDITREVLELSKKHEYQDLLKEAAKYVCTGAVVGIAMPRKRTSGKPLSVCLGQCVMPSTTLHMIGHRILFGDGGSEGSGGMHKS